MNFEFWVSILFYQILPNAIFLLSVFGVLVLLLRRLPEASARISLQSLEMPVEKRLESKGLPALAVSKIKVTLKKAVKKIWQFTLEAKDLKPHTVASYKIKKIFGGRLPLPKKVFFKPTSFQEVKNERYFLDNIKKQPKNLSNYDALGKFYMEVENISDAKDIYLYLTNHEPTNSDYHARLGFCFLKLNNFERSAHHYEASLALDSSQPNRYYNLGLSYSEQGKLNEAIKNYESAITLEPKNQKFYLALNKVCNKIGDFEKAKRAMTNAQKITQKESEADTQKK